jgi:hypothetical protein
MYDNDVLFGYVINILLSLNQFRLVQWKNKEKQKEILHVHCIRLVLFIYLFLFFFFFFI